MVRGGERGRAALNMKVGDSRANLGTPGAITKYDPDRSHSFGHGSCQRPSPLSTAAQGRLLCTKLRDRALFFVTCERLQSLVRRPCTQAQQALPLIKPSIAQFQGRNLVNRWLMRALTAERGLVPTFAPSMQTAHWSLVHFPGGFSR